MKVQQHLGHPVFIAPSPRTTCYPPEIEELNRIVVMWLDFAEDQARRRKQVFLKDWEDKLDAFLQFNDRNMLPDAGKVLALRQSASSAM